MTLIDLFVINVMITQGKESNDSFFSPAVQMEIFIFITENKRKHDRLRECKRKRKREKKKKE